MTPAIHFPARSQAIVAAIGNAAKATGVDFAYLLANARAESGLNPEARASTSSASGLFQFTDATWLGVVARHGARHGLGWAAEALRQGAPASLKQSILGLRHDAGVAATMAAEFTRDNAARLESALGRAAGSADLYLAAFFGAGGAIRFLKAMATSPGMAAASLLPAAAAANRSTFFAADGTARSLAEVHAIVAARIQKHGAGIGPGQAGGKVLPAPGNSLPGGAAAPATDPALAAARARMAYLMLAALQ